MVPDKSLLQDVVPFFGSIGTAGPNGLCIKGIGKTTVYTPAGPIHLPSVYWVPTLVENIMSQTKLGRKGTVSWIDEVGCHFHLTNGHYMLHPCRPDDRIILYTVPPDFKTLPFVMTDSLRGKIEELPSPAPHPKNKVLRATIEELPPPPSLPKSKNEAALLEHERLGHPGAHHQRRLLAAGSATVSVPDDIICEACTTGKMTKARLHQVSTSPPATSPLGLLHIDIFTQGAGKAARKYALTIVDDCTALFHVVPIMNKSQAAQALFDFVALAENQTGHKLKAIQSDNDSVFLSSTCTDWAAKRGVLWVTAPPYDSRLNGRVERANRTLRERMHANLAARDVPFALWPEAIEFAALTLNITPRQDGSVPIRSFWGIDPTTISRFLQPFGCLAWVYVP